GRLIVLHDITHRKQTEERLRYQRIELEVRNEQLDAFARTVAHDLKGPLNTLLGYGRMVQRYYERLPAEEIYENLTSMIKTGERMSEIIDSLLLLSRVYQLEDIAVDVLDMKTLVVKAIEQVRSSMPAALEADLEMPEAWPWIVGYGPWITEVWINYITNAIKYGGDLTTYRAWI
ncbi:MAG: histidine kinase dimerization/phospho-acceptor domain-containing protein, partial [Anaerolineae bacterium]